MCVCVCVFVEKETVVSGKMGDSTSSGRNGKQEPIEVIAAYLLVEFVLDTALNSFAVPRNQQFLLPFLFLFRVYFNSLMYLAVSQSTQVLYTKRLYVV